MTSHALPIPSLDAASFMSINELIGRSLSITRPDGEPMTVAIVPACQRTPSAQARLTVGSSVFDIQVFQPAALPELAVALSPGLPRTIWKMATAEAVSAWLALLQDVVRAPVTLGGLTRDTRACGIGGGLGLAFDAGDGSSAGLMNVSARTRDDWVWLVSRLRPALHARRSRLDPPLQIAFRLQPVALSAAEVAGLAPGDAIVLDERIADRHQLPVCLCVQGIRLGRVRAIRQQHGFRLNDSFTEITDMPANEPGLRSDALAPDGADASGVTDRALLDALSFTLHFELGQTVMTLAELQQLTPGQIILPQTRADQAPVRVLSNTRCIATGHLVGIGERLAVCLDEVCGEPSTGRPASKAAPEPGPVQAR